MTWRRYLCWVAAALFAMWLAEGRLVVGQSVPDRHPVHTLEVSP